MVIIIPIVYLITSLIVDYILFYYNGVEAFTVGLRSRRRHWLEDGMLDCPALMAAAVRWRATPAPYSRRPGREHAPSPAGVGGLLLPTSPASNLHAGEPHRVRPLDRQAAHGPGGDRI